MATEAKTNWQEVFDDLMEASEQMEARWSHYRKATDDLDSSIAGLRTHSLRVNTWKHKIDPIRELRREFIALFDRWVPPARKGITSKGFTGNRLSTVRRTLDRLDDLRRRVNDRWEKAKREPK